MYLRIGEISKKKEIYVDFSTKSSPPPSPRIPENFMIMKTFFSAVCVLLLYVAASLAKFSPGNNLGGPSLASSLQTFMKYFVFRPKFPLKLCMFLICDKTETSQSKQCRGNIIWTYIFGKSRALSV